ncbi:MAG TPA: hypothetical protein VFW23_15490 [Tepidisphaeraceae bacterium]|nr:hypothetical protein [Tepidisphaeraceae bacterium]
MTKLRNTPLRYNDEKFIKEFIADSYKRFGHVDDAAFLKALLKKMEGDGRVISRVNHNGEVEWKATPRLRASLYSGKK